MDRLLGRGALSAGVSEKVTGDCVEGARQHVGGRKDEVLSLRGWG